LRELLLVEPVVGEQHRAHGDTGLAGELDRLLDRRLVDEAELGDDVT